MEESKIAVIILSMCMLSSLVYAGGGDESEILTMLVEKIDSMQRQIAKLGKSEANLKQSIGVLIGTTAQFRLKIKELTEKLEAFETSDKEKGGRIKFLEQRLANGDKECSVFTCEQDELFDIDGEDDVLDQTADEKTTRKGIRQTPENVAFTAYLDHVIRNLGKSQPVVYNQVLLNDRGAYDSSTGVFKVPVSGVYLLSWSVTARKLAGEHAYDVWVKLMVNGVHQTGTVAESREDSDDNQGSNTIILRLNEGDSVWTEHYSSYPDLFGDDGERTTTFSGALLR